jgi:ATP-binding cassette subfamily B protein
MAVQSTSLDSPSPHKASEFRVTDARTYNQSGPVHWIWSHVWRYRWFLIGTFLFYLIGYSAYSGARVIIGAAADEILNPAGDNTLLLLALAALGVLVLDGVSTLLGALSVETIAQRLERDARDELYISLLGKSQVFHDRQRVGDIMARATDDMRMMNAMMSPGVIFIFDMILGFAVPITFIASVNLELALIPIGFVLVYAFLIRRYSNRLSPVVGKQREKFGSMNASLEESISGIEVVKASVQEAFERRKFRRDARAFRDYFVKQGRIEAFYLPLLAYGVTVGLTFLHAMLLYQAGRTSIPDIIAIMGLMAILRFPTFISLFAFSLIQNGLRSAERVLTIIKAETDLDENVVGHEAQIQGEIIFENVNFGYGNKHVLEDISFHIKPGETVAIVGQTGSGKSTLTQLVNRTYDIDEGRILIDGVDVREWSLESLRSQISKIEQDVFLFSRSISENIAFGAPGATQEQIEQAAREAQAHDFILTFNEGYQTKLGERGVTLSGGQRQRIALARAFLSNPRILILDDSTSAVDSQTEDQIQRALQRAQEGRTTLLITHRLSQIRWADHILVLDKGKLVARGTHEELLRRSREYRRIFARYDIELPPLEEEAIA